MEGGVWGQLPGFKKNVTLRKSKPACRPPFHSFPSFLPLDAPSQTHHGIDARAKKDGRNDPKRDDVTEGFRPKVGSRAVAPVRFFVDEDRPFLDKKFQGRDVAGWRERVREGRG